MLLRFYFIGFIAFEFIHLSRTILVETHKAFCRLAHCRMTEVKLRFLLTPLTDTDRTPCESIERQKKMLFMYCHFFLSQHETFKRNLPFLRTLIVRVKLRCFHSTSTAL